MSKLVMKFGGASVASTDKFAKIADLIIERGKEYSQLIIVVSAMGGVTDSLIKLANEVHPNPPKRELDMLISVGERISISLLAMALSLKGREAISFTGSQSGIITSCKHFDASVVNVKPQRILSQLKSGKIVIVAGFQGVSLNSEITTLGRGGSDISAVALAAALRADRVEFYKDVPGIFSADPKKDKDAICYEHLPYDQAIALTEEGAKVLHPRCIKLAKANNVLLHVRSFLDFFENRSKGTIVGDQCSQKTESVVYERDEKDAF